MKTFTLVSTARDAGITFVEHADVYGDGLHGCERRFAEAMRLSSAEREQLVIQIKAGIIPDGPYVDFSYEHIIQSVDGSLGALGTLGTLGTDCAHVPPNRSLRTSCSCRSRTRR